MKTGEGQGVGWGVQGCRAPALFWEGQSWEDGPEAPSGSVSLLRWVETEPKQVRVEGPINMCPNSGLSSFSFCGL